MLEQIVAAAAVIAAAVSAYAAYVTRKQVGIAIRQTELQQRMHEDASQPYVWADFKVDPRNGQLLQFVVGNSGPTIARNVRLRIDPPLPRNWRGSVDRPIGPEEQGNQFASIPPGRTMQWHLGLATTIVTMAGPKRFRVTIACEGPFGAVNENDYILDVNDYQGAAATAPGTLLEIKKSVDALALAVKESNVSDHPAGS